MNGRGLLRSTNLRPEHRVEEGGLENDRQRTSLRAMTIYQVLGLCSSLLITVVTTIIFLFKGIFNEEFIKEMSSTLQSRIMAKLSGQEMNEGKLL